MDPSLPQFLQAAATQALEAMQTEHPDSYMGPVAQERSMSEMLLSVFAGHVETVRLSLGTPRNGRYSCHVRLVVRCQGLYVGAGQPLEEWEAHIRRKRLEMALTEQLQSVESVKVQEVVETLPASFSPSILTDGEKTMWRVLSQARAQWEAQALETSATASSLCTTIPRRM